jgi:hypothetical protein
MACRRIQEIVIHTLRSSFLLLMAALWAAPQLHAQSAAGQPVRPFSSVGMALTAGSGGIGLELATPLARHFNLRARGSYFSYYGNFTSDGTNVQARLLTRSLNTSVDYYPFHNGFRISPGVTLDNANSMHGAIYIPGGQSFDLGDGTYTSAPGDPINGSASVSFGRRIAPSFTVGWGNIVPRRPRHFAVPLEIGFEYIGAPLLALNLQGSACDQNNNCGPIATDPSSFANEQLQAQKVDKDIYPLRFFPILSVGFGWSF